MPSTDAWSLMRVARQGPKLPPCWTFGKKKWNKGAPLSKKSTGVGRGNHCGKKDVTSVENEPPRQTVPLPADRNTVNNEYVREFLVDPPGAITAAANAQPPLTPVPVDLAPGV